MLLATIKQCINLTHTAFCSSDIKLQIHTTLAHHELTSWFYLSVIMPSFVPENGTFAARIAFKFNQKTKAVETYDEQALSIRTCKTWLPTRSGDFNTKDIERSHCNAPG